MVPRPIDTVGGWGFPRHVENLGKVACEDRIGLPQAMLDLVPPEQRVALVTGASRGIGRAVARTFARSGMRVALNARGEKDLQRACRELAPHAEVMAVPGDLSDPTTTASILDAVRERFGPVQILINNAGTAPSARFDRTGDEMLGEALNLHVSVPFRILRQAIREMGPGSCAVQIASTAGLRGFAFTTAYTAAKHAMVGLSRSLAAELGAGPPRIYALCPGFVDTDITRRAADDIASRGRQTPEQALAALASMNNIGRLHTPDEVAAAVTHLVTQQPPGCVYDLDRDPPAFVE